MATLVVNKLRGSLKVAAVKAPRILRRLARDNAGFEEGPRTEAEFDRWAPSALEAVSELRALTRERLGTV